MKTISLFVLFSAIAFGQTFTNATILGGNVTQDYATGSVGGYLRFPPITYNPYDGSPCIDFGGNKIGQPLPVPGATGFGVTDVVLWNSLSPLMPASGVGCPATTLSGNINSSVTTIPVASGAYIQNGNVIQIDNEQMLVTGGGGTASLTVTRGYGVNPGFNTTPAAHTSGTAVGNSIPVNRTYGLNLNGYLYARGGHATDVGAYNSFESFYGGMEVIGGNFGNSYSGGPCSSLPCGGYIYLTPYTNSLATGPNLPTYTVGSTSSPVTPVAGMLAYSSASNCPTFYNGSSWACIGTGFNTNPLIFTGLSTAPSVSGSGNANMYYDTTKEEFYVSYSTGAYTGLKAPVFNAVVTGLTSGAKTFQNSDGSWSADYQGNLAGQSIATNWQEWAGQSSGSPSVSISNAYAFYSTTTFNGYPSGLFFNMNNGGWNTDITTNGIISPLFNCTNTTSSHCLQSNTGTFYVTGGGDANFQSITTNGGYGISSSGVLNVASCTGCGGGGGVTWPTSGDVVISNGSSSPTGVAPGTIGNCLVVNSSTQWSSGSCAGGVTWPSANYVIYSNGTAPVGSSNFEWNNSSQILTITGTSTATDALHVVSGYISTDGGLLTSSSASTAINASSGGVTSINHTFVNGSASTSASGYTTLSSTSAGLYAAVNTNSPVPVVALAEVDGDCIVGASGVWTAGSCSGSGGGVTYFSAGTTGFTPSSSTSGSITLGGTLNVAHGGTGTSSPSLVAGTNITVTGSWPNQTINCPSCITSGTGYAVLSATQTFTGANTFSSSITASGGLTSSSGIQAAGFTLNSGGSLTSVGLSITGYVNTTQYYINGNTGVSCTAGSVNTSTMVVEYGIVTHC